MSRSLLIVLPKEMRSAVAPAAKTISISPVDAVSKARTEVGQKLQDLRRRVGFDRVEDARIRQRLRESQVVLADDLEINDKAGSLVASSSEKLANTFGHFIPLLFPSRAMVATDGAECASWWRALARCVGNADLHLRRCLDWEIPIRTLARVVASSVTPALHSAGRDKEARYVVALSRVPRGERGRPVHSGYRSAPTAFRPLVRVSVDRHATTGTCEIGQLAKYALSSAVARENRTRAQKFFTASSDEI